jgi:hypothetical protein
MGSSFDDQLYLWCRELSNPAGVEYRMASPPDIRLDLPCQVPWDQMAGDERVRFCTQCNLHVHNLSATAPDAVTAFLAMRTGRVCVAYERREDGSAAFADTPVRGHSLPVMSYETPLARRRRWVVPVAIAGAVLTAGAGGVLRHQMPGVRLTGVTRVAGGIGPPPLVGFDPRSPALPDGVEVVDVRYSVYPLGTTATYGQAYVLGVPGATPAQPAEIRAVIWLLPLGTTAVTPDDDAVDPVAPLRHVATLRRHEMFIDGPDDALAATARQAMLSADGKGDRQQAEATDVK